MFLEVQKIFDDKIRDAFKKRPDLKKFFLKHERKKLCIENLCEQIKLAEFAVTVKLDGEKYRNMIEQVAVMFCRGAIGQKENEIASKAEQRRREIVPEAELLEFEAEINEENAKVHRGQIIGQGWKPVAANKAATRAPTAAPKKIWIP